MASGVYFILNKINGKFYIGSTVEDDVREKDHWSSLIREDHSNHHLQHTWDKHKKTFPDAHPSSLFAFWLFEKWSDKKLPKKPKKERQALKDRETECLKKVGFPNHDIGYNMTSEGGSIRDYEHTDESKKLIAENNHKVFAAMTEEEKSERTKKAWKGKTAEERSAHGRASMLKVPPEQRRQNSLNIWKGKSADERKEIAMKGVGRQSKVWGDGRVTHEG